MIGNFTVTIEELFQMTTYDNYIAHSSGIWLCNKMSTLKKLYLNTFAYSYQTKIVRQTIITNKGSIYPLFTDEFLISKSTFIRLILILMVKECLGHHNNMGSCFLTRELLNYIKNQS